MKICRACMSTESIFLQIDSLHLENYNLLTHLSIKLGDNLPQCFCQECWNAIDFFIKFRNKCLSSELSLQISYKDKLVIKCEKVDDDEDKQDYEVKITQDIIKNEEEKCDEQYIDEIFSSEEDKDLNLLNIKLEITEVHGYLNIPRVKQQIAKCISLYKDRISNHKNWPEPLQTRRLKRLHTWEQTQEKKPPRRLGIKRKCKDAQTAKQKMKSSEKADTKLECGLCSNSFEDKDTLHNHLEKHKTDTHCSICKESCFNWPQLLSHRLNHVGSRQRKCHICWKYHMVDFYLEYHYLKNHYDQEFTGLHCKSCKYIALTPKKLTTHNSDIHKVNIKSCSVCSKECNNSTMLRRHMLAHHKSSFACDQCDFITKQKASLQLHKLRHHEKVKVKCKECRKVFKDDDKLKKHKCDASVYLCPTCGKSFKLIKALQNHVKVHTDARPYKCARCPATFKRKGPLKEHVNRHDGNRTNKCDFCPAKFYTRSILIKHRRTHTGEKPYVCKICARGFTGNHNLKVHMKIHGESLVVKRNTDTNVDK